MTQLADLISKFESTPPEIIFEWNDSQTSAKGWIVINSLRGGASGGGTRMRDGLTKHEVISLAKTMEIKFTVSGPQIGGAKSGINFNPKDPRKSQVLKRWFKAVTPLLKFYYGTGGDMNIDETKDVVPITESLGLWHPQEGIVQGYFTPNKPQKISKIGQLRLGVPMVIANQNFTPNHLERYTISDMITGYGVAQSVIHYYNLWRNKKEENKSVLIQGWGNVGASAGFFLSKAGFKIVGIMDKEGFVVSKKGFNLSEITRFFCERKGNQLVSNVKIPNSRKQEFWQQPAQIFLPCAGSRLVTQQNINQLIKNGCQLISCGANVPFNNTEILYGDVLKYADQKVSVIPDFIANCGMARTFAYCMEKQSEISSSAIFKDVSNTIFNALNNIFQITPSPLLISERGLTLALKKLI